MADGPEIDASSKNPYKSKFGEPVPMFVSAPAVARDEMADETWLGGAVGTRCKYEAANPATCGEAIEVPVRTIVAVLLVHQADVTSCPGAKRSRQAPKLLPLFASQTQRASDEFDAPTLIAEATRAGDSLHASMLVLPAATTTVTPAAIKSVIFASRAESVVS